MTGKFTCVAIFYGRVRNGWVHGELMVGCGTGNCSRIDRGSVSVICCLSRFYDGELKNGNVF